MAPPSSPRSHLPSPPPKQRSLSKEAYGIADQILCTTTAGAANCPANCPVGTFRNGENVAACNYVLGGRYVSRTSPVTTAVCPANSFAPTYSGTTGQPRTITSATLQSCEIWCAAAPFAPQRRARAEGGAWLKGRRARQSGLQCATTHAHTHTRTHDEQRG